jgi:hypothetical protein
MGNQQSTIAAESLCAVTKQQINSKVDEYLSFIKNTSVEIDEDIEDLSNELAVIVTTFKESTTMKSVSPSEYDNLVADVERHTNNHKHSLRRMFTCLGEAFDIFEDMASTIGEDSDDDDDSEDSEDSEGDSEDEDESINDDEVGSIDSHPVLEAETSDSESEHDSNGSNSDDDSDSSFEEYEEDISDDDVLQLCRFAACDLAASYQDEMTEMGLDEKILSERMSVLREMSYSAAECAVADAVKDLVEYVRGSALEDVDDILSMGIASGTFASNNGQDIREILSEAIAIGAVARQTLEDLPFSRRDEIEMAQEDIVLFVEDKIRQVQMSFADNDDVIECLMDLDIDDYGDDYLEDDDASEDSENDGESSDEDQRVEVIEEPKVASPKKTAPKKAAPKKTAPKKAISEEKPAESPKKAPTKNAKRKAVAQPEEEAPTRATRSRRQ